MKKNIIHIILLLFASALNISIPDIGGAKFNFLFLLVVLYAFKPTESEFLIISFFAGLFMDVYSGNYFGMFTFAALVTSILINYTTRTFFKNEPSLIFMSVIIPLAYLVFVAFALLASTLMPGAHSGLQALSPGYLRQKIWLDIMLNVLAAGPMYWFVWWLDNVMLKTGQDKFIHA